MDVVLLTPAFIREAAGAAFLDQVHPFFVCTSRVSFSHGQIQLLLLNLEWDLAQDQEN